jgi:hypothetical protein
MLYGGGDNEASKNNIQALKYESLNKPFIGSSPRFEDPKERQLHKHPGPG